MFKSKKNFYLFLVLIIILSLAAGVLGEILSRNYLAPASGLFANQELDLNSYNNSNLVIRDAKKVVVNSDLKVAETATGAQASLVKVFKKLSDPVSAKKTLYYDLDKALASGFILTSDGWVALNISPVDLDKAGFKKDNLSAWTVINSDKKEYALDQFNAPKNSGAAWVFVHLKGANNLPVKKILDPRSLTSGQSLIVVASQGGILPTFLVAKEYPELVRTSDVASLDLVLANPLTEAFKNSYIFDLNGDLLAWVDNTKKIIPAQNLDLNWQALLKSKSLSGASLGVYYLDLNRLKLVAGPVNYGALVYQNASGQAFTADSPALKAGLKLGDIILRVDSQELKGDLDLAAAIAAYQAGETVTLTYWRNGQENRVDVKLAALK